MRCSRERGLERYVGVALGTFRTSPKGLSMSCLVDSVKAKVRVVTCRRQEREALIRLRHDTSTTSRPARPPTGGHADTILEGVVLCHALAPLVTPATTNGARERVFCVQAGEVLARAFYDCDRCTNARVPRRQTTHNKGVRSAASAGEPVIGSRGDRARL